MERASVFVGFDAELLAQLPAAYRVTLEGASRALLLSCLWLAVPLGIAVWKTEHKPLLSLLCFLGTFFIALNCLRLVIAGGGAATHEPFARNYRPSGTMPLLIAALAMMLAQPAQLLLPSPVADAAVETHRQQLNHTHRELLSTMGLPDTDHFVLQTERCEFVVLRLALLWQQPLSAVLWTFLYTLIVTAPFLLLRTLWLPALTLYESARHRRNVRLAVSSERLTRQRVHEALSRYPTYVPGRQTLAGGDT